MHSNLPAPFRPTGRFPRVQNQRSLGPTVERKTGLSLGLRTIVGFSEGRRLAMPAAKMGYAKLEDSSVMDEIK